MNRKLLILLSFLLPLSCGGGGPEEETTPFCRLVGADGKAVSGVSGPAKGQTLEIGVEALGMWTVSSNADWVGISPSRGNKYGKFTLTVLRNSVAAPRSAVVTVKADGADPVTLAVDQEKADGTPGKSALRFMSFNIRTGGKADGSTDEAGHEWSTVRKPAVFAMFSETDPDIAVLQECRQEQLNDIEPALSGYTYYRYACDGVLKSGATASCTSNVFQNSGARNVVMLRKNRFSMLQWGVFWLSETPDTPSAGFGTASKKVTLWLKVRDQEAGKDFYVFNIHFITPGKGDVLLPCANCTVERMKLILGDMTEAGKTTSSAVVFLAGDFNAHDADSRIAPVTDYLYNARSDALLSDPSMTYNSFSTKVSDWKRLDHIFYAGAKPQVFKVVNENKYGTEFISDHFPVYCDFEL